jgi:hypothetical protein
MHDPANGLRRISLLSTRVNKGETKGRSLLSLALQIDPVGLALEVGCVEDHCDPLAIHTHNMWTSVLGFTVP